MAGPSTLFQTGIHSARPAANAGCVLYSCTTHGLVYRSDGSAWTTFVTLPSGASSAAPALTFGTAASAGVAATYVATDATLPIFDATVPTTQAIADAAAAGAAGVAARRDHKHGWPARTAFPGAELDYAEVTSPTNITATSEATANTIVTGNAVAYDGSTIVMIEFFATYVQQPSGDSNVNLWLYDGSSSIGRFALDTNPIATGYSGNSRATVRPARRITPSNASHTYSVRGSVSSGTGVVAAGAGGSANDQPAFLRITRV